MDVLLLKIAALFYLLATGSFIGYLISLKRFFSRLSPLILLVGFLVHSAALGVHFFQIGYPGIAQFQEAVSFYGWLMIGLYLLFQLKYPLRVLGSLIAPLGLIMALAAFAFGRGAEELPPALKSYWLPLHVSSAFLGNAVFALAFGVSLMYLFEEYQLKRKKVAMVSGRFPSLETLDRLNHRFLIWGFPLMTLGIITGSLWAGAQWGNYWSWEPRQISSALTWLLYGALLHGRITGGWRGRKGALLTIAGFALILSYFLWGDTIFPGRHAGRFE